VEASVVGDAPDICSASGLESRHALRAVLLGRAFKVRGEFARLVLDGCRCRLRRHRREPGGIKRLFAGLEHGLDGVLRSRRRICAPASS